jgi:phenylalanyl-tRNA synthetase beta chain
MGGEATGCDETTTDVLIESALWNEINIAQTGRKLGINSDARYRFERGVDPAFMVPGLELATKLALDICGGSPSEIALAGKSYGDDRMIEFPVDEVKRLAGIDVPLAEIKRLLTHLGFMVAGQAPVVKIAVPSWRADVHGKADIVEEIVRIVGVDRVPLTPFDRGDAPRKPVLTPLQLRTRRAKRALAVRGMVEAVTWSFLSKTQAELFGGGKPELALANPIASDLSDMRPSLVPGLIAAAQANADRGFGDVALFEVGQIFLGDQPEQQLTAATGVRRAMASSKGFGRAWSGSSSVDAFDAKADALALLDSLGLDTAKLTVDANPPDWFHPGQAGVLKLGPTVLATFGTIHPDILDAIGFEGACVGFTVDLGAVPLPRRKGTERPQLVLSPFQPLRRDFAFIVAETVTADKLLRAVRGADKAMIVDARLFDVYTGTGIAPGMKSLAVEVTLQPAERTLTDAEIEAIAARIVAAATKETGATLRG